jgi:hypothetical protein
MEENKVLLNYYMFTIPHITVLAGSILGILLILKVDLKLALGIFSTFYGAMLSIINLIVREQFSKLFLYKLSMVAFIGMTVIGVFLLLS